MAGPRQSTVPRPVMGAALVVLLGLGLVSLTYVLPDPVERRQPSASRRLQSMPTVNNAEDVAPSELSLQATADAESEWDEDRNAHAGNARPIDTGALGPREPEATAFSAKSVTDSDDDEPAPVMPADRQTSRAQSPTNADRPLHGSSGRWWCGPVTARAGVFLFDAADTRGVRRVAHPAPPDERYVILTVSLTWEGHGPRDLAVSGSSEHKSDVQLAHRERIFDPIGRLGGKPDPLAAPTEVPLRVRPGGKVRLTPVFLLPENVTAVSLVLDGRPTTDLELPSVEPIDPPTLTGRWRRMAGQLAPLRYGDRLIDAIADVRCRVARISTNDEGFLQLSIPTAGVTSGPLNVQARPGAAQLGLARGDVTRPGWLRSVDGGASILLYVGESHRAAFLYERD